MEKFSRIFKITLLRWLFSKMVSNLWFLKNLQGIFHIKLKAIFFNGISFENWRRSQKKIKGISFVKFYPRASLARAAFTLNLSLIPAIDLFFPCLWSEVKWSESESESIFGPLIFFNLRYIKGGVRGNNNIGIKKCTTNFLWVLNFGQVGELPHQFSKSPYYGDFFQKDFPYKIEGDFF